MPPAARVGDMHTCPMVTPGVPPIPHVGGPILPPGCPTVLIGGQPAARVGDMATCVGPPDAIAKGSMTVMIGGQPAARMGDLTAHGGVITLGLPTVMIGDMGMGAAGGGGGVCAGVAPAVDTVPALAFDNAIDGTQAPGSGPQWTEDGIKSEWQKTSAGRDVLKNLPPSTKFKSYDKPPGSNRNAYYSPKDNTIYIPKQYSSQEAAPTAAHEAVHADQCVNHKRPKDDADRIRMEIEAKNKGLDVYDQMGQPKTSYNYKAESDFRKKDPKGYNQAVQKMYEKAYGVKGPQSGIK